MRWPWTPPQHPDPSGLRAAKQALAQAQADEPRVARIVEEHKRRQAENHFGPAIKAALKGQPT